MEPQAVIGPGAHGRRHQHRAGIYPLVAGPRSAATKRESRLLLSQAGPKLIRLVVPNRTTSFKSKSNAAAGTGPPAAPFRLPRKIGALRWATKALIDRSGGNRSDLPLSGCPHCGEPVADRAPSSMSATASGHNLSSAPVVVPSPRLIQTSTAAGAAGVQLGPRALLGGAERLRTPCASLAQLSQEGLSRRWIGWRRVHLRRLAGSARRSLWMMGGGTGLVAVDVHVAGRLESGVLVRQVANTSASAGDQRAIQIRPSEHGDRR